MDDTPLPDHRGNQAQGDDGPDDDEDPNVDGIVGGSELSSHPFQQFHAPDEEFVDHWVPFLFPG